MSTPPDLLGDALRGALAEFWSFPDCAEVESVSLHFRPPPAPRGAIFDVLARARKAARVPKPRPGAPPLPPATKPLAAKPLLYWLLTAKDPVASVIADTRDPFNVSVNNLLMLKVPEIVARLATTPDARIHEAGDGTVRRRRPADVRGAVLLLKEPGVQLRDSARWAAVAVCTALEVGLCVEDAEFADAVCWSDTMTWVSRDGDFVRMTRDQAETRICDMARRLVVRDAPAMGALRAACACLRVARPYQRSRGGLVSDITRRVEAVRARP